MDFHDRQRNRHSGPSRTPMVESRTGAAIERSEADLHICPRCSSQLVQPVEWAPIDMRRWRVELECPDCSWNSIGFFPQDVLDRYDEILDRGAEALQDELNKLERTNMEAEIEAFTAALDSEQILPEDF